ncbi:hypothetical protein OTB20_19270 [Streptomyces sp. H27-H1]|uniref:hypothetical protein n=1 Tax=Streptomyces sp. H27-H1 TaxID=2996461 RepID=UPI0022708D0A|nr:hypothetical protein [Streptomyces sp. H27-H1]MCY0928297.1 hypothetical protein [Streptomyces sp. H27-H1]
MSDLLGGSDPDPYELAWYSCDATTGNVIEELRSLTPTQALSRKLGTATTASLSMHLGGAPADWEACTTPGRTLLVAVDVVTDLPIWSGVILTREGGSDEMLSLGAITPEAYLDRRYVDDHSLIQQDQANIITAMMATPLAGGLPFVMDAPATGVLMDSYILATDDRTSLSAMQQVMAMDGGPEWTCDVEWASAAKTGFILPLRVRPKIGLTLSDPEAVFDLPGCIASYRLIESYESGSGATVVTARGEGEGASRLTSDSQIAADLEASGWPRYVYRFTPASGITDPTELNAHAARALALMRTGSNVWSVEGVASRSPRLGRDWALGDTVRVAIEESPRHPNGADVVARAWSWELDADSDRIRPILVEED